MRITGLARRLTLDHVWVISLLALIWLFISVLPLPPNDLWWHMAAGRTMVSEGAWMRDNRWAYTLPYDAPYVYQSWLSEVLLYGLWRFGDVPMLALVRALVLVVSYGLVAWHAWRRADGQGWAVALALLVAVLIGWNNWTLRPQTLALVPGAAFAAVLGEHLAGRLSARWLAALPALMVLWVNMHGSFVLGVVLMGMAWLGVLLAAVGRPDAHEWRRVWRCTGALAAVLLAVVLNPLGVGIFGYVRGMLANNQLHTRFVEWLPPRNPVNLLDTGFWFFTLLLLLAVLMSRGPRRPAAVDLLWYCGLAWLTISGVRYAMWFGLLLLPLFAERLALLRPLRRPQPASTVFLAAYGLLIGAALVAVLPWFEPSRYFGPGAAPMFATEGRFRMLLSSKTPVGATAWLAQNPIEGRFWTDMSYSSYTIWELPTKQVFADLRVELFPDAVWDQYFEIVAGDRRSLELLDQWQITHLLLDRSWQKSLHGVLASTPGWCERYGDRNAVIMARCR